ncbi:hypothetical protein B0H11DRAFT_2298657 [Mycena galericulata]|nr:hypothetical protein B0H11DRAFT_2298657 [Mycena galericulata]
MPSKYANSPSFFRLPSNAVTRSTATDLCLVPPPTTLLSEPARRIQVRQVMTSVVVADADLLAASWINCMLFSLEIVLLVQYFQKPRPLLHQVGVSAIFAFDTVCTFAVCAQTTCDLADRDRDSFYDIATASLEQMFLCYLFFTLTKQRLISVFLVCCIALHLSAIVCIGDSDYTAAEPLGPCVSDQQARCNLCAVTDILLRQLCHTFIRMESTSAVSSVDAHSPPSTPWL